MSQSEWFTTYLEYENLKDMLNVMLYTSQSFMTITPLLYYITYHDKNSRWYCCPLSYPLRKTKQEICGTGKMTGEFNFVNGVVVRLIKSTLRFPIDVLGTV